ncbi:MAG: putative sulfate exporter family transporter [Actinomycetaceae bacterium]|nr:putative sulfate exporter family transporter [Actinomycetaceae bacterium]
MAVLIAVVSFTFSHFVPLVSPLLGAIVLGLVVRNLGLLPEFTRLGLGFSAKTILRLGVVLLGFRLAGRDVLALGWRPLLIIFLTVVGVYLVTLQVGKLLRVGQATAVLTATGTAICGAAAVAGMSSVVKVEDDEDVDAAAATAIASVTIFGLAAMFLIPVFARLLGFSALSAGVWIGAGIHEVGQVVGAATILGGKVVDIATLTKLGRVVLLAPMIALVGYLQIRAAMTRRAHKVESAEVADATGGRPVDHEGVKKVHTPVVPYFVVGFIAAVAFRTIVGSPPSLLPVFAALDTVATFLLTVAMAAMGAGVILKQVLTTGLKGLLLGLVAGVFAAVFTGLLAGLML